VVVATDWASGQSASLRAGLEALEPTPADTAVVLLVDLPDVDHRVVARLLAAAGKEPRSALVRAVYHGRPGHPVVLGRAHWAGIRATLAGDSGARDYLAAHAAAVVECSDLASGQDLDVPAER
jgi:CTP:molybdopterin cytidylyltransferase MocA